MSSLCAGRARFFALTLSPSPTLWARGVGAHGGAPCCAFPLSREAVRMARRLPYAEYRVHALANIAVELKKRGL